VNPSIKESIDDRYQKSRRVDYSSKGENNNKGRDYEGERRNFPEAGRRRDNYNNDRDDRRRRDDNNWRGGRGGQGRDGQNDRDRRGGEDRDRRVRDERRESDRRQERNDEDRNARSFRDEPRAERSFRSSRDGGGRQGSSRRGDNTSVRFRDEPLTPAFSDMNTPARRDWDDDDSGIHSSRRSSQWDYPTPLTGGRQTGSREDETPMPTPTHKFNPWVKQPGSSRFMETPWFVKNKEGEGTSGEEKSEEELQIERDEWEDEQKRLDREWYSIDEGYDEVHNPFAGISEEYTKKKEDQIAQKKNQRMSAQQRQIHRDNELWEKNRMLTSGVVVRVEDDEEDDGEAEARVHLLVHHIVPPFLDGRIVFTKQFEPVVPVRVRIVDLI